MHEQVLFGLAGCELHTKALLQPGSLLHTLSLEVRAQTAPAGYSKTADVAPAGSPMCYGWSTPCWPIASCHGTQSTCCCCWPGGVD